MARVVLVVVLLLGLAGCAGAADGGTSTGNVVTATAVAEPHHSRWFTGRLLVEPAGPDRACLLLATGSQSYVLRPVPAKLAAVAWQTDGKFDATRSGIARGDRMIAPYADERTSVRGGVVAKSDGVCSTHPTLAFAAVRRGGHVPEPSSDASASVPAAAAGDIGVGPLTGEVWKSGRLSFARGNQGEGYCLLLVAPEGAYALGSGTNEYDTVITQAIGGGIDERRTGIHIHGRNPLGMARTYGQQAEVRGTVMPGTDFTCSRYPGFSMSDLR